MAYVNQNGQVRIGVRSISNSPVVQPAFSASLLQSIYGIWNGDTTTNELGTSLFGAWNGETSSTVTTLNGSFSSAWNGDSFYSTSGITASNVNNVTLSAGKIGNSFTFNGSNYVSLPASVMNFTGDFTVNFWIKINSTAVSNQGIMGNKRWGLGPGGFEILFNGGWLQALGGNEQNGASGFATNGGLSLANATSWTMVTFIYRKGVSNSFYINAGTPNTVAHQHTLLTSSFNGALGKEIQDNYYLNGNLDAVTFWNREITENEILALYNSGNGREYPYPSTISIDLKSSNDNFGTNHGTLMNGCTFSTGKIGSAFTFDGINDYVALPDNIFNFTGDFSASAWFYTPSSTYTHSGIVGNYNWGTKTGWGIYTYQNRLYANIYNVAGDYSTAYIDNSVVGSWNHVTMVFKKGTGFYLYMNGELKSSFTLTNNANAGISPAYSATQKAYIGLLNYSGDWWYAKNGYKIDGVNVWQRAISQDEITQLYNSGTGAQYPFTGTFSSAGNQLGMDNGTMVNGCYLSTGKVGQAFTFDGVNDYVSLPDNSFNFTGDFSVSAWIYVSNLSGEKYIISNVNGNALDVNIGWCFGVFDNKVSFWVYPQGSSYTGWLTNTTMLLNTWYHVSVTKKTSQSPLIYINGTLSSTSLYNNSISSSINPIYSTTTYPNTKSSIGVYRYNNGSSAYAYWNGKIDALNVYQRELTQSEVTELYNSGNGKQITATPIVQSGLVLNLDASRTSSYTGTGTTWTDISGNGYNGTLTNGAVFGTASGGVINFDGVNDYIDNIGNLSTFSFIQNTGVYTISAWVKPNSLNTEMYYLGNNDGTTAKRGFYLGNVGTSNSLTLEISNGTIGVHTLNHVISNFYTSTDWINIVCVGNGVNNKVYKNGVLFSTSSNFSTFSTGNTSNTLSVGRVNSANLWYWNGGVSSVGIYNRSLSDSEVLQNFNATKSRFGL